MKITRLVGIMMVLVFNHTARSQAPAEKATQPIIMLRYFEDYQFLSDSSKKIDFMDPIKYIPLSKRNPASHLSIGGDIRFLYEYISNRFMGETNGDGYLLHRYMLHADWHLGNRARVFGQMGSTHVSGREAGPRPAIDQDELFVHQLFTDIHLPLSRSLRSTLRIGRQEVVLGSGRLVTIREGPNTRLSFDGAKWLNSWNDWTVEALYIRPVNNQNDAFDNETFDNIRSLWGVYANWNAKALSFVNFDGFFLGYNNDAANYHQARGTEDRYITGLRVHGVKNNADFNLEGGYQFGTFEAQSPEGLRIREGDISSYGVSLDMGYQFKTWPLSPRVGLKTDYIQGDQNREDLDLNTANALFPNQGYFRGAAPFFPSNFIDLHPEVRLNFNKTNYLVLDWTFYWRESLEDGIYLPDGTPINPLVNGNERYLGSQADVQFYWQLNRNIYFMAIYAHFFRGGAFEDNPYPVEIADFVNIFLSYKF